MRYDIKSTVPPPASQTTKQSPTWEKKQVGEMSVRVIDWVASILTLCICVYFPLFNTPFASLWAASLDILDS